MCLSNIDIAFVSNMPIADNIIISPITPFILNIDCKNDNCWPSPCSAAINSEPTTPNMEKIRPNLNPEKSIGTEPGNVSLKNICFGDAPSVRDNIKWSELTL